MLAFLAVPIYAGHLDAENFLLIGLNTNLTNFGHKSWPCCLQADASALELTKQLIGNNDEVTDLRLLGPPTAPTHIAVSSNSEVIRVFSLADMSCTASLAGEFPFVLLGLWNIAKESVAEACMHALLGLAVHLHCPASCQK